MDYSGYLSKWIDFDMEYLLCCTQPTHGGHGVAEMLILRAWLPVRPGMLYTIWLNSRRHSEFTGSPALIDARVNGDFSSFNGYVSGIITELIPGRRIVQTWRTLDFAKDAADSRLEVLMEPYTGGTVLTLVHRGLTPEQLDDCRVMWEELFLQPLKDYLEWVVDAEDMH